MFTERIQISIKLLKIDGGIYIPLLHCSINAIPQPFACEFSQPFSKFSLLTVKKNNNNNVYTLKATVNYVFSSNYNVCCRFKQLSKTVLCEQMFGG